MAGERAARPAFPARAFHRQECLDPAIAIAIAVRRVQVDRDRTMVARQPPFESAPARARLYDRSSAARIAPRRAGDRQSVVCGTRGSVRVVLGVSREYKITTTNTTQYSY